MCGVRDGNAKSLYHLLYPTALELEHSRGTIPTRSKVLVRIKVRPARQLRYIWSIKYAICTPRGEMMFWNVQKWGTVFVKEETSKTRVVSLEGENCNVI